MPERDQYFLGHSSVEQQRLQRQANELAGEARWLFDQIGLPSGARVVEIGCGPQGCLDLLSERVGPNGSVVGVEMSDEAVTLARRFLEEQRIANAEVRQGDGKATGLPRESFDLATCRLVLVNVPEPEQVVTEMMALVKPGGVVAFHEADWGAHVCDPPLPAWERLRELLDAYSSANGIDLFVGRRVPRMLRAAGLEEIRVNPVIHVYPHGHSRRPIYLQFAENLHARIVAQGLTSESEFTDLIAALRRHLEDPDTLVVSHLFLQVWGVKPRRPVGGAV